MEIVYVLVAVVAIAVGYFLFFRKSEDAPRVEAAPEKKKLPEKRADEKRPAPAAEKKKAPAPAAAEDDEEEEEEDDRKEPAAEEPEEPEEAAEPEPEPEPGAAPSAPARPSLSESRDVQSLRRGLAKSRESEGFFGRLRSLITGRKEIDASITADIEEVLLASDVGVATTEALLARVKEALSKSDRVDADAVWDALRREMTRVLHLDGRAGAFPLRGSPTVVLMVGVNGAGKTTTIGKLATKLVADGKKCVLAAGDTFRAAAVQQLVVWGDRVGCEVVRGKDGADPGSVVFSAIEKAREIGADVVLADTAGRLHTKANLMSEMKKIAKTAAKAMADAPHEVLLVVDATTGQNALAQAAQFKETLDLTGIVLTKLDGTAKGGVILGIADTLGVPVRFVGLGERADDLHDFHAADFVEALLGGDDGEG